MKEPCGAIFDYPNSSSLYNALLMPPFPCAGCGGSFTTERGREGHVVGVHLGLLIPCSIEGCHSGPFKQESSYRRHVVGNAEHAGKHIDVIEGFSQPSSPGMTVCCYPHCSGAFPEGREFAHHVMNEHLTRIPCPECKKVGEEWCATRMPALLEHMYGEHANIMARYIRE